MVRKHSKRGRYSRNSSRQREIPVSLGEIYSVAIQGISKRGDGIAKINGFPIFVPGGRIRDRVTIQIVKIARGYAVGRIVE